MNFVVYNIICVYVLLLSAKSIAEIVTINAKESD